jgi:hypothetical protein
MFDIIIQHLKQTVKRTRKKCQSASITALAQQRPVFPREPGKRSGWPVADCLGELGALQNAAK